MPTSSCQNLASTLPCGTGLCVINLDERTDRWEEFQKRMIPYFQEVPIERISATKGIKLSGYGEKPLFRGKKRDKTWGARAGCVLSHRDALQTGYNNNWPYVLVLEDDICVSDPDDGAFALELKEALEFLNPDVCYFGFTDPVQPFLTEKKISKNRSVHRVYGCNTAHAYLVKREVIPNILSRLPEPPQIWKWLTRHRAVDRFFYRNLSPDLKIMAISPPIIDQMAGYSDIMGKVVSASASDHVTEVPPDTKLRTSFEAALQAQALKFKRAGWWDAIRGYLKYVKGF